MLINCFRIICGKRGGDKKFQKNGKKFLRIWKKML